MPIVETLAAIEVARLIASGPTPDQITAFHPSPEAAARAYDLIYAEREGTITDEERAELESCVFLEEMMRMIKAEAHSILARRES